MMTLVYVLTVVVDIQTYIQIKFHITKYTQVYTKMNTRKSGKFEDQQIASMSIFWLLYCTIFLQDVTLGRN